MTILLFSLEQIQSFTFEHDAVFNIVGQGRLSLFRVLGNDVTNSTESAYAKMTMEFIPVNYITLERQLGCHLWSRINVHEAVPFYFAFNNLDLKTKNANSLQSYKGLSAWEKVETSYNYFQILLFCSLNAYYIELLFTSFGLFNKVYTVLLCLVSTVRGSVPSYFIILWIKSYWNVCCTCLCDIEPCMLY